MPRRRPASARHAFQALDLDSPFDRLTAVASAMFDAPHAMISVIDGERTLFRAHLGLGVDEMPRELTLSDHMVAQGPDAVIVVEDGRTDPRTAGHVMVTGAPFLRFFIGATIADRRGRAIGAIGVMDTQPRSGITEAEIANIRLLARMAADLVEQADAVRYQSERLELLRLAEEMAGVGQWQVDPATMMVTWSDEVYRIHGVEPGTFDPSYDDAVSFYHPEDRPALMAAIAHSLAEGVGYRIRLRLVRADGAERIVETHAECERGPDGAVTSLFGVFRDLTEESQARTRIAESEQRYRLLAENTGDVITRVRLDGTSRYISPAIEAMLGWRYEEMSGQGLDYVHPEDRAAVVAALKRAAQTGERTVLRHRAVHRDGRLVWVECTFKSVGDVKGEPEIVAVIRDVSEQVLAEQATAESEARYRLLADRTTDVIITYGPDGLVRYFSPAVEAMTGYRPEELIGRSVADVIHVDDREAMIADFVDFARDPARDRQTRRYRIVHKSGEVRWAETRATVTRDASGRAVEFQDTVRDVSETKALEGELIEARDRAEAGARAKSEFLANMSHELRTPLTSVIGFAGLLKGSPALGAEDRRHVERIALASDSLLGVINDILDYSKLEAGAVSIDPQAFDPRAMAQGAMSIVEGACQAKGLAIRIRIDPSLPPFLLGDEARLRQVVLNFLSNAVKFTSDGGVTVGLDWNSGRMRVSVADTGIGVAPDKLAGLFQRFTQADASTSRLYGGTGLGLSISRRLVEMMGGKIGADSRIGEGSTFWFEAPFEAAAAAHMRAPDGAASVAPEGLRVLMADDAPANRELVGAILGGMGMTVETVEDGVQAVEAARTGRYDLILMDVHMPNMDGMDATRAIRGLGGVVARVPIIALTANVQPEQVARCREAGMDAHVGKPIAVAELVRAMVGCLAEERPKDSAVRGAA